MTGDRAVIVDIKTGARALTKAEAEANAQLAMYQLAAEVGGFEGVAGSDGAELVYIGTKTVAAGVCAQARVDATAARARLDDVVETMAASGFEARVGPHCDHCPVRRSCPAQPEGAEVSGA